MAGRTIGRTSWALLLTFFWMAATIAQETPVQEAARLQVTAARFLDTGKYNDGIAVAKRALALREQALGNEHPEVAASLQTLGRLYLLAGNFDLAQSTQQRALALREQALGPEHPDTAKSLVSLADVYFRKRSLDQAASLYERALPILEKVLGVNDVETAKALLGLANVHTERAAYDRAEPLFERALVIQQDVAGAASAGAAKVLYDLATMYRSMGAYARALTLYRRVLAIREAVLGSDHPETAVALASVAIVYTDLGEQATAEPLYQRALAIHEKVYGSDNPNIALALHNLGSLYVETGNYAQAEPLLQRAISIQTKSVPADAALPIYSLAFIYAATGRYAQAEPLYQRALELNQNTYGAEHPLTIQVIARLGDLYRYMGAYDKAEPLLTRAVLSFERTLGPDHMTTADTLDSLADVYTARGQYLKAEPMYRRALAIAEKAVGPEHHVTAEFVRSLAELYWLRGDSQQALLLLQRAQLTQINKSERLLSIGSEARKQDYLQSLTTTTFGDVSFSMSVPGTAATALGLTSVLHYKGRVLDVVSGSVARLRRSVAPADQALLEQLAVVASELSSLTYGQNGNLSPELYREHLAQLSAQRERLEVALASRSQVFSREVSRVTLTNVQQAIPGNAVLVEWFRYAPIDPKKSVMTRRGAPRYVAYILKHTGEPVAVDVGEAQAIETLARRLRVALADPASSDIKQHSIALSEQLLTPLRVHLRGAEHILFSPDGELNLLPMAALVDESGAYLVEHFDVSYLTSGRDLLRIADNSSTSASAVIMADPEYGERSVALATSNGPSLQLQRSADLDRSGLQFRSLAGTALEARDLKSLLQLNDANVLLRQDASESNLKQLKSPRILHIASHGFFLSDQQLTAEISRRRGPSAAPLPTTENPLLRSGIALAGANRRSAGDDDGILTALEATQLDLSRTELVVLSACDSAVGEVQNGEGVYGLRRALTLAGAQTQVTSLWKVSDDATRHLMVDYYRRLQSGAGRSAALRSTQRAMLASANFTHPYYWAGFIPIGNWQPLPAVK